MREKVPGKGAAWRTVGVAMSGGGYGPLDPMSTCRMETGQETWQDRGQS